MNSERKRILQMVQRGTLNAGEGAALLGALGPDVGQAPAPVERPAWRWLVVRVTAADSGRRKVHVRVPYRLIEFGLRMGDIVGFDADEIQNVLDQTENGSLLEVIDDEDNEHVQIFLE